MRRLSYAERAREWVVDYSAARAKAIEWLGDRYLLARPVKRRSGGQSRDANRDAAVQAGRNARERLPGRI